MGLKCYTCKHKRNVPGNAHVMCLKPDDDVTGDEWGIQNGWFIYPVLFDPTWGSGCKNHEENNE